MTTPTTIDISDAFLRIHDLGAAFWKYVFRGFALVWFFYSTFGLFYVQDRIGWLAPVFVQMLLIFLAMCLGYLAFQTLRPLAAWLRIPFPRLLQPDVWETPYRVPGVDVVSMLARLRPLSRSSARWKYLLTPRRPVVALLLGGAALGIGWMIFMGLVELEHALHFVKNVLRYLSKLGHIGDLIAAVIFGIPLVLGYLAFSWLAADASHVVRAEAGTYLILLRAFSRDEFSVRERATRGMGVDEDETRLEDVVAKSIKRTLPLIAIGDPKELVPTLGANRAYFSDSAWRENLLGWLAKAKGAAILLGGSHHLTWEMEQLKQAGLAHRSMFLFPDRIVLADQLIQVAVAAGPEIIGVCLGACTDGRRVLAVVPGANGAHTIIVSKNEFTSDYELACKLCLAVIVDRHKEDLNENARGLSGASPSDRAQVEGSSS